MKIMNNNIIKLFIVILSLTMTITACKKKPEGEISIQTKPVNNVTSTSAQVGGIVSYTGAFTIGNCGICYGKYPNPTLQDFYMYCNYGTGSFDRTLENLTPNTQYYVRAYAYTSSGLLYGPQESFTTKNEYWLTYGADSYSSYGLLYGGTLTWGVMFPSEVLSYYDGMTISKIKFRAGDTGNYSIDIYKGGNDSPTTLIQTNYLSVSQAGEKEISINGITLDASDNLWITVSNTHGTNKYPASYALGKDNPNARWRRANSSEWTNTVANGWKDLRWCIQFFVTDQAKGEEYEIILP